MGCGVLQFSEEKKYDVSHTLAGQLVLWHEDFYGSVFYGNFNIFF